MCILGESMYMSESTDDENHVSETECPLEVKVCTFQSQRMMKTMRLKLSVL
jgi:hypothetical protein